MAIVMVIMIGVVKVHLLVRNMVRYMAMMMVMLNLLPSSRLIELMLLPFLFAILLNLKFFKAEFPLTLLKPPIDVVNSVYLILEKNERKSSKVCYIIGL